MIRDGGLATLTDEDDPGADVVPLGRFLYEPDGAVIRAGLVTAVAAGVAGGLLDRHIAYVTADAVLPHAVRAFLRGARGAPPPREAAPRRPARTRDRPAHDQEAGCGVDPDQLRKRLALTGDDEATIVLTRVDGQGTCLLVRPVLNLEPRHQKTTTERSTSPWCIRSNAASTSPMPISSVTNASRSSRPCW